MIKLLNKMRRKEWLMAGLCALLVLGQIYFDLRLPDYMSNLTVLIKTPGSAMADIWKTGLEMLGCTLDTVGYHRRFCRCSAGNYGDRDCCDPAQGPPGAEADR